MTSYRPITDVWILARSKVKYYGAYPAGFLGRARDLLGVGPHSAVLHVCGGRVKDYPFRGLGKHDRTVDLDAQLKPDYCEDVRSPELWSNLRGAFDGALIDRPYTPEDAERYVPGRDGFPELNQLLRDALTAVSPGRRVGVLDYLIPRPPKTARFVACVGVIVGFGNRGRFFTVFERTTT